MFIEYKQGEKHAGKGAARSETMDSFQDCGQLLTDDDIVIDIDHLPKESIKALISEFGIKTETVWTERGAHLWFKKPSWFTKRKDCVCRLGFSVEQHNKLSRPAGMTTKRNGVERKIDNPGVRMYLPRFFAGDPRTTYKDLTGMAEGDGRNKDLFAHRIKLNKFNAPDMDRIIAFINFHVFAEPLGTGELESITRDMPPSDEDSKYLAVVNTIMRECRTVRYSERIWWFDVDEYITDPKNERLKRRVYETCEAETTRFVDEVIRQIEYKSPLIPGDTIFPIRFNNGILQNGKFINIRDYREFSPYYIPIDYKPDAKPVAMVDEYINNLTNKDPDYRDLLMEVIGYVMITDPEQIRSLGKFFMFRGDGANGKGTLMEIMKRIYNAKNCTNLSIKQLVDDRFKVTMIGKLANLGDDVEAEAIDNDQLKILKNISTADTVATRHMYIEADSNVVFTVKLYFTTNSDIRSFEKGYAYRRRIVWLPMFNKVEKPDPKFITKLTTREALEYWISLIVEGYKRLYENTQWTECKQVTEYNEKYHQANDICSQFANDLTEDEIRGKTMSEMKLEFSQWDSEGRKFSPKRFKEVVWDLYKMGLGVTKVSGKSRRVFMTQEDTTQVLEH